MLPIEPHALLYSQRCKISQNFQFMKPSSLKFHGTFEICELFSLKFHGALEICEISSSTFIQRNFVNLSLGYLIKLNDWSKKLRYLFVQKNLVKFHQPHQPCTNFQYFIHAFYLRLFSQERSVIGAWYVLRVPLMPYN